MESPKLVKKDFDLYQASYKEIDGYLPALNKEFGDYCLELYSEVGGF